MTIDWVAYAGWEHCLRLTDGRIEAIVTTDVGPRIIRFGAVGGANLLHENPAQRGLAGGADWRAYGGHRLWHAPEAKPRTYAPDNGPVACTLWDGGALLSLPPEPASGIAKQMELRLDPDRGDLEVSHRLTNHNPWAVELAPWAITMMAAGGVAVMPQEPYAPHPDFGPDRPGAAAGSYLPVRSLGLWSYTRLDDPRWGFLDRLILTRQDPSLRQPLKYGVSNRQGWCGYLRQGEMLVKRFHWQEGARYPDLGCNAEVFTDGEMLELETLGPLVLLAPGQTVEHEESWSLLQNLPLAMEAHELAAQLARHPSLPECSGQGPSLE
jgi:hypothetical protein